MFTIIVYDSVNIPNAPLVGASISMVGSAHSWEGVTDSMGYLRITDMPAYPNTETYTLTVTKAGYHTFKMTAVTADGGAWDAPMLPGNDTVTYQNVLLPIGFTIGAAALIYYVITRP